MLERITSELHRGARFMGLEARELEGSRMIKIIKTLESNKDNVKTTPLSQYIDSLDPTTLNFKWQNHDLLWHLICHKRLDLIQIIMNKDPKPQVSNDHIKYAEETDITIYEFLKKLQKDSSVIDVEAILTPFFELAKNHLWESFYKCLYSSSKLIKPHINSYLEGETLLCLACKDGEFKVAKTLIELGARCDIPAQENNRYPLHYAIMLTNGDQVDNTPGDNIALLIQLIYGQAKNIIKKRDSVVEEGRKVSRAPLEYASEDFCKTKQYKEMEKELQRLERAMGNYRA